MGGQSALEETQQQPFKVHNDADAEVEALIAFEPSDVDIDATKAEQSAAQQKLATKESSAQSGARRGKKRSRDELGEENAAMAKRLKEQEKKWGEDKKRLEDLQRKHEQVEGELERERRSNEQLISMNVDQASTIKKQAHSHNLQQGALKRNQKALVLTAAAARDNAKTNSALAAFCTGIASPADLKFKQKSAAIAAGVGSPADLARQVHKQQQARELQCGGDDTKHLFPKGELCQNTPQCTKKGRTTDENCHLCCKPVCAECIGEKLVITLGLRKQRNAPLCQQCKGYSDPVICCSECTEILDMFELRPESGDM